MRIKTFYAKTMADALREIKATLGPEALLLSTKEVPRRSGVWGRSSGFEVVAAVDYVDDVDCFSSGSPSGGGEKKACRGEAESRTAISKFETYGPARGVRAYAAIPAGVETLSKSFDSSSGDALPAEAHSGNPSPLAGPVPGALYRDLVDCGVDTDLARELLLQALDTTPADQRANRATLLRSISQAARARIAAPTDPEGLPGKKVVAFIGPTGVGKTTSIAKLAARLAFQKGKKVILVALDGFRIGAIEQLRSYAGLMGIPFRFADQIRDLNRVIEENGQRDYILIDTAGRSPRDRGSLRSLAAFLNRPDTIEQHLVLSAGTNPSDLRGILDAFEVCAPDHLLFTKLDETSAPGPMLNALVGTQKRFSYYTDGQRVPDDLHAIPGDHIMDLVLNHNENTVKE